MGVLSRVGRGHVEAAARVAIQAVFSLVVTWPLAWWLGVGIPNGTERAGTVAFFNLWSFRWNQQQIPDLFRSYWDGPSFHPEPGAFALSDPQPVTGLVFAPISWLTGDVIAYNAVVLLTLTLNGVAASRLSRRVGVGVVPAVLIGLLAQALPFAMDQLGVIQLAMFFPLLLLADAILAWAESATWPRALAIGAWLAVTLLTCGYYGLFALVIIVPASLVLVRRDWFGRRLLQLGGAALLFGVVCTPFFLAQARYTSAYSRPERVIQGNSAPPGAYLMLNQRLPGASWLPWLRDDAPLPLYPGTILLVLAAAGVALLVRQRHDHPERLRALAFLGAGITLAVVVSLGLHIDLFGWQPYRLLREHVPGFGILRTPFRTAVIAQAFLLPLAAVALDRLWSFVPRAWSRLERAPRRLGPALAALVLIVGLAEIWPAPQQLIEVPAVGRGADWVDWLAEPRDPGAGDGSVAMVPFPPDGRYQSYEATTTWMLAGLDHGRPLVNGYSSLFPARYNEIERAMRAGFPSDATVSLLARARVSWVVVTREWLAADGHEAAVAAWAHVLRPTFAGRDMVIYELVPPDQ